jgi:hypothetical protein
MPNTCPLNRALEHGKFIVFGVNLQKVDALHAFALCDVVKGLHLDFVPRRRLDDESAKSPIAP